MQQKQHVGRFIRETCLEQSNKKKRENKEKKQIMDRLLRERRAKGMQEDNQTNVQKGTLDQQTDTYR